MRRRLITPSLLIASVAALLPLYWLTITALKPRGEILQVPPTFWPHDPSLENFEALFTQTPFSDYLVNSFVVVTTSTALALVIGGLAAYSLARFRFRWNLGGRSTLLMLLARMVPPIVIVIPLFTIILGWHLEDTRTGLILIYTAASLPVVVWLLRSFIAEIPRELEEAAMTDGASRLRALRTVVLPLSAPGIAATAIFTVIIVYNEFIFALVLTTTPKSITVPVGAASFIGKTSIEYGPLAAAGVVSLVPLVLFALLVQRHLVRGLTMGAFK